MTDNNNFAEVPDNDGKHMLLVDDVEEDVLRDMMKWYVSVMKNIMENRIKEGKATDEMVEKFPRALKILEERGLI